MQTNLLGGVSLLIRPLVQDLAGKVYDSRILAERLASAYGISLPAEALESFTTRLVDTGVLFEEETSTGITRAVYAAQDSPQNLDVELEKDFQEVIDDFLEHCHRVLARAEKSVDEEKLIDGFLRHLASLDFSAIKARQVIKSESTTTLLGPTLKEQINLNIELAEQAMIDAMVASYVTGLVEQNEARLALLAKVADGALAAELVFDLRAPTSVPRLSNTTVVIDTPLLLSFLNLSSAQDAEDAKRLFASIQEAGAKIAAYQHSIEEAEGILRATNNARTLGEAYGPAISRLSNAAYRAFYDSMLGRIATSWLQTHHFEIIQETATHFYKNFSGDDEDALFSHIRLSLLDRVLTRERDAKSIAETMRRLGGAHVSINNVAACRFIFVTQNTTLQRRAEGFLRGRGFVNPQEFVPVATSRYIAGLCWLICGGHADQSPTIARLLSNCANALRLRPEIADRTKKFLAAVDAEKALHFEALMTNERASQYLAEATFNNPDLITANNINDIYEAVQRRAAEKVAREKDDFYTSKIDEISSSLVQAQQKEEGLTKKLTQVQLEAEERRIEAERLRETSEVLTQQHGEQRAALATQSERLEKMEATLIDLQAKAEAKNMKLERLRQHAAEVANEYADKWVLIARLIGATLLFAAAAGIGYFDKFIIPKLPTERQELGNYSLIGLQALMALSGLSLFVKPFSEIPLKRLRNYFYRTRLAELYIDDTES